MSPAQPVRWSDATLVEVAAAIAQGAVSARAVTEDCLARIDELQPAVNAFLRVDRAAALAAADRADSVLAGSGPSGPLHGVPLAHKDMYYREGQVSTCGSRVRAGWHADRTATTLARLDAAGAIDLGTLNMSEFALGPTGHNAHYGPARNPWHTDHITGGSSSGSGASVAARLAYGSLGSDTGGSVRLPACMNGVVGMKPTYGLVSRYGTMGISFSVDTPGPLARTARDCARLLGVIAGHDPRDVHTSRRRVPDYEASCERGVEGLRIGVPCDYFYDGASEEIRTLMEASLAALEAQGAKLVEVTLPDAAPLTEMGRAVIYAEATALHGEWLRTRGDAYSEQVRVRASTGVAIPSAAYLEALHLRPVVVREFVNELYAHCDVLHAPTLAIPVPTIEETDVGSGEAMWRIIADLVRCTGPVNYLGLPALAVPAGFTANGLPAGFQLIGRPFDEARLLQVAAAYEAVTDWVSRAPGLCAGPGAQAPSDGNR